MNVSTGPSIDRRDRIAGVLLGTAVGDALGLPREGLSPRRAHSMFGDDLRHALVFGRGMISDDTEHTCLVAQALLGSSDDPAMFARSLAWKLRFWLLGLPAGVGLGTARAIGKLWIGFGPETSGVYSAGNGPAMRAAILGVCCGSDPARLRQWVRASTRITHTDPRAERAAFLVAFAAGYAAARKPDDIVPAAFLVEALAAVGDADDELRGLVSKMESHLARGATVAEFATALGLSRGVTGYAYHTVPVALYGWLSHSADFRAAVADVIRLGGDADTTGAIVGAVAGAGVGLAGIPKPWIDGLREWPRSAAWMTALADRLARRFPGGDPPDMTVGEMPLLWPALLPRNLAFLAIVLAHGFRRVLPPYERGRSSKRTGVKRVREHQADAEESTTMLPVKAREHLDKYWSRARESFAQGDHPMAAFFAITLIEEVGKVVILGNEKLSGELDQKSFRSHANKYAYAVGMTLAMSSRVTRVYGELEARFAAWFRSGELFDIRNSALYLELVKGDLVVPADAIDPRDAFLLVCIAGEVLADIQGSYTGGGPEDWQRYVEQVDAFRDQHKTLA